MESPQTNEEIAEKVGESVEQIRTIRAVIQDELGRMHTEGVDLDRRSVLGGVGLLGSGALLGNWLGGSKSKAKGRQKGVTTTTNQTTINGNETPSRPSLDLGVVSADAVRTSHLSITKPVTMYVRKGGDDGNDGYSESNPKATIPAAIKDAPLSDRTEFLRIDVGEGEFEGVFIRDLPVSWLEIRGTMKNGKRLTTLSGSEGDHTIDISQGGVLELTHLNVTGGSRGCIRCRDNSTIDLENCRVYGGKEHAVLIAWNAYYRDDKDTVIDQSEVEGNNAGFKVTAARADMRGTYVGDGSGNCVLRVKENGYSMLVGCTIRGEGNSFSETSHGIRCFHNSAMKISGCTIADCYIAINREMAGWIKVQNGIMYDNTSYRILGEGGFHRDMTNDDEEIWTLPRNDGTPDVHWGSNTQRGGIHYNDETDLVEIDSRRGTLETGRTVVDEGTATVGGNGHHDVPIEGVDGPVSVDFNLAENGTGDVTVGYRIRRNNGRTHVRFFEESGNAARIVYKISAV